MDYAEMLVRKLKNEEKCDFVIALTHMLNHNDSKLAHEVKGIDFILGGHDHLIKNEKIKNAVFVKSGTNFKHFSVIKIFLDTRSEIENVFTLQGKYSVTCGLEMVTKKYIPDPDLNVYVN